MTIEDCCRFYDSVRRILRPACHHEDSFTLPLDEFCQYIGSLHIRIGHAEIGIRHEYLQKRTGMRDHEVEVLLNAIARKAPRFRTDRPSPETKSTLKWASPTELVGYVH